VAERLESAGLLDAPGKALGKAIRNAIPAGPVKDTLSGTWLGHALHPMLTDIPIGAWTSATLLDLLGGRDAEPAARRLIAIGLAAAPPTFVTGWNDWADTEPASDEVRRAGLVHAACNGVATGLLAASYAARRRGDAGRGKLLSLAAVGLISGGGWLGGHLSYARGVGVDQTVFETPPQDWTATGVRDADLLEGRPRFAEVAGTPVMLLRQAGRLHALVDRCNHRGGPLHEGEVGDGTVTCPLHGSCFRLEDGSVERGPATFPQRVLAARVRDGAVEIRDRG
jgi:nitrite reductase/ring-hydroxylating ferredoxin subunit/uncharacterized membrane protein